MKPITAMMYAVLTLSLNSSNACTGIDSAQNTPKYAVLLIDAEYSTNPTTVRTQYINLDEELENMGEVLKRANTMNIPVFEINFDDCYPVEKLFCTHQETSPELARYRYSHIGRYRYLNWIDIRKKSEDAFKETSLQIELSSRDITDIVVMGYHQQVCVRATTISALSLGYTVHTSFDVMQGDKDLDMCELIVDGKSTGEEYPCFNIPPELVVKPTEDFLKITIKFYRENTRLVDNYRKLPLFEQ